MRRTVVLLAAIGAMLVLVSGVALGAFRYGTDGGENIYGTLNVDVINGNGGSDKIYGFDGSDELRGSTGNDGIYAGFGNDRVFGGPGSDGLHVGSDEARDYVNCGPGYDRVYLDEKDRYATDCEVLTPVD